MRKQKKLAAFTLLVIYSFSTFYPGIAYGLTNGPTAPESSHFKPTSVTNLVDPFSGDFNYNIPLLDVDGYPVNIAYTGGGSMDDEASWVGYGWNINPGSVSRTKKGIPDDFDGTDRITKKYNIRPDVTGGITFNFSTEIFGLDFLKAHASADIFYNNHRGLGVELGAGISATLNTAKASTGDQTYGLAVGGNLGVTSNSQTGADFNFGASVGLSCKKDEYDQGSAGLRFNGSLNSRAGMLSTTLGGSFNTSKKETDDSWFYRSVDAILDDKEFVPINPSSEHSFGSSTSYYGQAFNPTIVMPMKNLSVSLSPELGPEIWGFQIFGQMTGHYSKQSLASSEKSFPAYGFIHSAKGRTDKDALLDFNREKDVPYMENTPTLPVPYVTQDIFSATSQAGSSQFRAFSNSSGVFFDAYTTNKSTALGLGVEFGIGGGLKGGVDLSLNGSNTATQKWKGQNDFLANGDFSSPNTPDGEDAYFKLVGEKSSINKNYLASIADRDPVKIKTDVSGDDAKAYSTLASNTKVYPVNAKIARNIREPKGEIFSPMTADKAKDFALDKMIKSYELATPSSVVSCGVNGLGNPTSTLRTSDTHKGNHFSQITLTKNDGMRLVYGIPVYNNIETNVSFNVGPHPTVQNNMVSYSDEDNSTGNSKGDQHYFSSETIPAYATSFLLSGVCSPDYVDRTNDGITDDDLGSAVKFNYTRINEHYKWRTPNATGNHFANYSEGLKSQEDDNKASLSYGDKELWYTHSIESKNMIAVFRLEDRHDGFGVDPNGSLDLTSKQKKLTRIDLYTKAELLSNPSDPVPVKSVHFEYDYSLFHNVPNSDNGGGKLTLTSIYFTYGKSTSGAENRYYFKYNESGDYQYQQYDRWGNYKDHNWNNSIAGIDLDNNDFPYAVQDKVKADEAAKKWQLSEIELPSGGKIKVNYESDDYAYVQNRRAMQMAEIIGYGSFHGLNSPLHYQDFKDYQKTNTIYIQLPGNTTNDHVKWEYFEDIDQLYFKTMVNLSGGPETGELVSGWAKITGLQVVDNNGANASSGNKVKVTLEKRKDYHPVAAASWQFLRSNVPKLAYPYSVNEGAGPLAFIKALVAAIRNVGELTTPFESKAMRQGFGSTITADKGFARIENKLMKYGGGSRVRTIIMDDIWQDMADNNGSSTYTGLQFEYTKKYKTPDGEMTISSGVASYEPMAGSEENPFKLPIVYQQKQHLTSNEFTVEEPLGESYFPGPCVGYSEVTIKNLDVNSEVVNNGYTIKKFYTEKDFPTIVKRTDLSKHKYHERSIFELFSIDQGNSVVLSQGFYVENNDMHGKPLSEETFDGSSKLLSGTYFHYKTSGTEQLSLDNNVLTLRPDGSVQNDVVGQEFEMFHDMRQQTTENIGVTLNLNLDVLYLLFIVIPVGTVIPIPQSSACAYQGASTIKVVNKYAIPDKITTIENGSTTVSENVLWDALTGQVLLTKTQNGFDDPLYNFTLPAYMVNKYEKGMGAAYHNTGIVLNSITVPTGGQVPSNIAQYLVPGDEVGIIATGERLWVMDATPDTPGPNPSPDLRLIKKDGSMYSGTASLVILRSGRRNLMGASTYSVVSLKNPIKGGKIDIGQTTEILTTSAGTFSDEWSTAAQYISCNNPLRQPGETRIYNKVIDPTKTTFTPIPVSSLAKGAGQNSTTTGCDPCNDLNNYLIESYQDVPNNKTCIHVKYICTDPFPDNKVAIFSFERAPQNTGGFGQLCAIEISHNTTEFTLCIDNSSIYSGPVALQHWRCITKVQSCDDVCTDINAFDISSFAQDYGIQGSNCGEGKLPVAVRYNCMTPFPANKIVHFTFTATGPLINETHVVDISSDQLEGEACFPKPTLITGSTITLVSVTCTTNGCCPSPVNQKLNPYYTGLKGNWRGKETYVYTTDRDPRIDPGNLAQLPTNTRKGGIFNAFSSFYTASPGGFVRNTTDPKWIASATVTKVNNKGQEVENKNALEKYSAAQFGFNELAATAVSSNARDNEIGYDGFEDYAYYNSCGGSPGSGNSCNEDGHFNFKKQLGLANGDGFALTTINAHTGNYSVSVSASGSGTAFTNRKAITIPTVEPDKYAFNSSHEMILKEGGLLNDFNPYIGKKYILSGWIKGDVAAETDPTANRAKIVIEGNSGHTTMYTAIAVKAGPKVEGWTRVMTTFELPANQNIDNVTIRLVAGDQTAYFDDIRINPYDGNMKTFAYDYRTSRLMAVLDENNYATFYEYDDEGQLLRNKKETEKGIVTLKETRSRVHKNKRPE